METLLDEDSSIRNQAAKSLGTLIANGDLTYSEALEARRTFRSEGSVEFFLTRRADEDSDVRPRSVDSLVAALDHYDKSVRSRALWSLKERGDVRVVELLVARLAAGDANVRALSVEALGELGDLRSVGALVGLSRRRAAQALVAADARSRRQAQPRAEVGRCGKARQVGTDLRGDGQGRLHAHRRNRGQVGPQHPV